MLRSIVLVSMILLSFQVSASIGKVSAVRGEAQFLRDDQALSLSVGDAVEEKDKIKTGDNTKVQIVFKDRTIVTIGKNTDFSISQYVYGDAQNSKAEFNLAKGVFKSISGHIGKLAPQRFKIKTKTSTIGIRGTTYIVRVEGSLTTLSTLNGQTYMVLNATGTTYNVPQGQELVYNADTGQVRLQAVTTTTISLNGQTPAGGNSPPSGSSGGVDDLKEVVETTVTNLTQQQSTPVPVVVGQTAYSLYGYWLNPVTNEKYSPFFGSLPGVTQTTEAQYNEVKNSAPSGSQSMSVKYSGSLAAVAGVNSAKGSLSMNINFTKGKVEDGYLTFNIAGETWASNFSGTATYAGIKATSFSAASSSTVKDISGNLNGTFYGASAQGLGGTFALSGTNETGVSQSVDGSYAAVSANAAKITIGSDDYLSYGYWLNTSTQALSSPFATPVSGVSLTSSSNLQTYINSLNSQETTASYSGSLAAISGTHSSTGLIYMTLDGSGYVSGDMNFTINGATWNPSFSNAQVDVNNSQFKATSFSGNANYSGSLTGKFYGDQANTLGGTFDMTRDGTKAEGSFSAPRTSGGQQAP